jgi:hypothetical protein
MAATSSIVDDFSSSLNTTRWPANNGVTVSGGQANLTCNTNYADLSSAFSYTFDSAYAKVTPAPANGGTTGNCYLRMALVASGQADGTFLGIVADTIEGTIYFQKAVGYWDNSGPGLTYSSTAHAWWKIALVGTNVVFSTSPDGTTWTTRYTTARPTYYNSAAFQLTFEAHRDSGTANTAIVDNVNTTATVTTVTGSVTMTAGATQALAGVRKTTGALASAATGTAALAGVRKTTGAISLTSAGGQVLAGTRGVAGAMSPSAGGTLTLAGKGTSLAGGTMGGTASFAVDGTGTAFAAADLAAGSDVAITGGRLMNPNIVGGATMTAVGSFSLSMDGSVSTTGELVASASGAMMVSPDQANVITGELLLFAEGSYFQWANKTVVPIAFGYLTGEVDA